MRSLPFFLLLACSNGGGTPTDAGPESAMDGSSCFPPPRGFDPSVKNGALTVSAMPLDARAIALDHQGRIVIAGAQGSDSFVARLAPSGMVDTSFGDKGVFVQSFGAANDVIQGIAVDAQDRVLVAGGLDQGGSTYPFAARLTTAGTIDSAFTTFVGNVSLGNARAVTPIVAGGAYLGGESHFVMRLLDNGTVDATFKLVQGMPSMTLLRVLETLDGVATIDSDGNLSKYGKDGTLDPSYGSMIPGARSMDFFEKGMLVLAAPSTVVLVDTNGKPTAMSGDIGMVASAFGSACNRIVLGGGSNGNAQVGLLGLDAKSVPGDKVVDTYPVTADASTGALLSAVQSDGRIVFVESVTGTGVVEFARVSP
jgi:uncharacterized delta-60 repeat protein